MLTNTRRITSRHIAKNVKEMKQKIGKKYTSMPAARNAEEIYKNAKAHVTKCTGDAKKHESIDTVKRKHTRRNTHINRRNAVT